MTYDYDRLLDPAPMGLETGFERLPSGVMHIAVRTDLRGCTGAMFQWWFGSRPQTREYRWWHPIDHISSTWQGEATVGEAIGLTHVVEEHLTDLPPIKLFIQFRDPEEAFDRQKLAAARESGDVSGLVYGHVSPQETARFTDKGALVGTRLVHLCRDTEWGTVLRSRFLFGYDLPGLGLSPQQVAEAAPDTLGPNLVRHCYDEFTFLSQMLPALYRAEALDPSRVRRPW